MVEKLLHNTRLLKIIIIIFAVLLAGSSSIAIQNFEKIKQQEETVSTLTHLSEQQKDKISELENTTVALQQNLSRTEEQLKNETQTRQIYEKELINLTMVAKSEYGVLAVDDSNRGHFIPIEVIIKNGSGDLFLNVANVLFDEMLQSSAQTAVKVAREITGANMANKDILINIEAPPEAQGLVISGGSAGGAITLASIAAMSGKTIRKDVLMTGTINDDHTIGKIGEPRAKALAAKENGAVIFLVPAGQAGDVGEVGIEIREVRTIEEAMQYAIPSFSS